MTMTNMKIRVIRHEIPDTLTSDTPTDLENAVFVVTGRKGQQKRFDIGSMCYRKFDTTNNESVKPVDTSTLDTSRYPLIKAILDDIRTTFDNEAKTKINKLGMYRLFVQFINDHCKPDFDFSSESDFKAAYQEYTKLLYTRMKFADGNPLKISNNSASVLQKRTRRVIQLAVGTDLRVITFWATPIRYNDREKYTDTLTDSPLTDEDKLETYAALCDLIHQAWSVLVKRDKVSVVVGDTVVFDRIDLHKDHILNPFLNKTSTAAFMSFLGASGANKTPVLEAKMSDERTFEQADIKGLRLSGIKYRGGIAEKEYTIVTKYLQVWKKWQNIRDLMLEIREGESDAPFIMVDQDNRIRDAYDSASDANHHTARLFREVYCVKWVNAREWRKFYAQLAREATDNDIIQVAKMLGNSIQTAVKSYENINLADHAETIRHAMNLVHSSAGRRVRDKDRIEVKIVSDERDANKDTLIGECDSGESLNPSLVDGFNDLAPKPDCRIKETCIFCEKYAAHADDIDIRKLLSFKLLIAELGANMPTEEWAVKWAPYEDRINEILDEMRRIRPEKEQLIIDIEVEVSLGELDEYWADVLSDMYEFGRLAS